MPEIKVDFGALGEAIGADAVELFKDELSGAQDSLKEFGKAIGLDMIVAVRTDNDDWMDRLKGQLQALAEIHRISLNGVSWEFFAKTARTLAKAAMSAVKFSSIVSL